MSILLRVLVLRARSGLRGLRERAFALFVLGPIVLGGAVWSLQRWVLVLREEMGRLLVERPELSGRVLALGLTLTLAERARRELASNSEPWALVIGLSDRLRWIQGMFALVAQALVAGAGFGVGFAILGGAPGRAGTVVLAVALALVPVVFLAALLAALRLRWRLGTAATAAGAGVLMASAFFLSPFVQILWWPWKGSALLLEAGWKVALGGGATSGSDVSPEWLEMGLEAGPWWLSSVAGALLIGAVLHAVWGRADLERAEGRVRGATGLEVGKSSPGSLRWALVRRDLAQVGRGFSPRVPSAFAVSGGGLLFLASPQIRSVVPLIGLSSLLAALALGALVPGLLAREEAASWNDRMLGVNERDRVASKVLLGGLLALPAAAVGGVVAGWAHGPAGGALTLLAVLLGGVTATSAAFELPDDPELAVVWGALLGSALACLVLFVPSAWWLWTAAGGVVVGQLAGRGAERLRRPKELR